VQTGGVQLRGGAACFRSAVNAAECRQAVVVERLRPERYSIDPRRAIFRESAALDGSGIRLQGHLEIDCERELPARGREEIRYGTGGKQARRAAAEEDADDFAAGHFRRLRLEIALQRLDIAPLLELPVQGV